MYRSYRLRLYLAMIITLATLAMGQAVLAGTLPTEIRVGLSYGKSAWATANFSGNIGLAFGTERSTQPLWTSLPNQKVTLIGDGFRLEVGRLSSRTEAEQLLAKLSAAQVKGAIFHLMDGSWAVRAGHSPSIEGLAGLRSTLINTGFIQLKDVGGYRLELQESFSSRMEVEQRITVLKSQGITAYAAFQAGWRIWIGESTATELDGLRAAVEKTLPGIKTRIVNPDVDRVVVLDQAGDVALIYTSQPSITLTDGAVSQRADNYRVKVGTYANILAANQAQQQLMSLGHPIYRVKSSDGSAATYSLLIGDGWELSNAVEIEKAVKGKGIQGTQVVGPYRLVSFSSYPSLESAQSKVALLRAKGLDATVLYDNGWRVAVGNAAVAADRDALKVALSSVVPLEPYLMSEIDAGRMQVFDTSGNTLALVQMPEERQGALRLWPVGEGAVYSEEKKDRYPGVFEFRRYYHGGMTVINRVGVEDYVAGVAAKEMYPSWPLEALKAQAVASRSYATTRVGNIALSQWGCDVDDTTATQVYAGLERAGYPNIQKAVKETAGQYAWFNGQIANTYFHSDGGGHTENSENVWTSVVPYIRGVRELFPSEGGYATWQENLTGEEIRQALVSSGRKDVGTVTDLIIEQTGVSGAPTRLRVVGTAGEELLLKDEPRGVFGFLSNNFTVIKPGAAGQYYVRGVGGSSAPLNPSQASVVGAGGNLPLGMVSQPIVQGRDTVSGIVTNVSDKYVFNGRGFGHGLGLSQWGAKAMADHGYTYIQILQHYYQGIVIK